MIMIECCCAHHAGDLRAIVMFVIAGIIKPRTWIPCIECGKIAFWIDEDGHDPRMLDVIEGSG
jgi:hypothetical protein